MYKMNLLLKIIITFFVVLSIIISNNYITLWALLVLLTFYNYKNIKLLVIDVFLIILLAIVSRIIPLLVLYKIVYLFNLIYTFILTISFKDKRLFKYLFKKYENKSLKEEFYNANIKDILDYNEKQKEKLYNESVSIDDKVIRDLDRKYLQSKIRFNGYSTDNNRTVKLAWNRIDTMLLLLSIIVFIIICLIGR